MSKSITIICPTRNRLNKLDEMLDSLPTVAADIPIKVVLICDGDLITAQTYEHDIRVHKVLWTKKQRGSVYCRNRAMSSVEDMVLWAVDDIVFEKGAIRAAVKAMDKHFPDGDGIVGFHQKNAKEYSIAGVGLMGAKFINRYPDRKIFYPSYYHFSCQEIARAGEILGKIFLCKSAKLMHYHPGLYPDLRDSTHDEARVWKRHDRELSKARKKQGLTWGING